MKVVLGFPLHHKDVMAYAKLKGIKLYPYSMSYDNYGLIQHDVYIAYGHSKSSSYMARYSNKDLGMVINYDTLYQHLFNDKNIDRTDKTLIKIAEGNHKTPNLRVVEIPDDVKWYIDKDVYDNEYIVEHHRTWS